MIRKPVQFTLRTTFFAVTLCCCLLGWAAAVGGQRVVGGFAAVMLLAGIGVLLQCLGVAPFGFSVAGASMASLLFYGLSYFVAERFHGYLLLGAGVALWFLWFSSVARGWTRWPLFQQAAGFTWGFLAGVSILVSIQNARDSVNWPAMLPALAAMPFVFFVPILPFWAARYLAKTRKNRNARHVERSAGAKVT